HQTATIMPFFKSNKNKSASSASTPAQTPTQTPRSSVQVARTAQPNTLLTHEQVLEMVMQKTGAFPQSHMTSIM
ncbi:hypothetical protein BGZ79_003713, partial [Entomortierella chlamydospora]